VRLLAAILQKEGFHALEATNGPEGRALARSHLPDLILLDHQIPGEDGLETCRQLKTDPPTSQIPIMFISGEHDVRIKVAAFDVGAVDYITKPFARPEVDARVRLHLRMHQAQRAIIESQAERLRHLAAAQQSLLVQPADVPEARFAVSWRPRHEAGGDFYDVVPVAEGLCDYLVADVAGHDIESSLTTAAIKVLVHQNAGPLCTPHEMVMTLNAVMHRVYPEGPYVTLVYARLNRARRVLTVVLAGHPPLIHVPSVGTASLIADSSELVGAFDNIALQSIDIRVHPGDRLYLYTDGLI